MLISFVQYVCDVFREFLQMHHSRHFWIITVSICAICGRILSDVVYVVKPLLKAIYCLIRHGILSRLLFKWPIFRELLKVRLIQVRPVPKSKLSGIVVRGLLQAGCPSCHPTDSIKALKYDTVLMTACCHHSAKNRLGIPRWGVGCLAVQL